MSKSEEPDYQYSNLSSANGFSLGDKETGDSC